MYVYGVNHLNYLEKKPKFISNASYTTNCLAPVIGLLDKEFEIIKGSLSTIHAVTASQSVIDKTSNQRRNRSVFNNIIPTTTGAANALKYIFPHLEDRIDGIAFRVPVLDASCIDLTVFLKHPCTKERVKELIECGDTRIIDYTEDEVVSSDFLADERSSVIDIQSSSLEGRWIKVVSWYDNELGYTHRLIDMCLFVLENGKF